MQKYEEFLARKAQDSTRYGFAPVWMPDFLFDFQGSALEWHLVKGRSAALLDCGMGKGPIGLCFAENVVRKTNRPALIAAPLAVAQQFVSEADKFGIEIHRSNDGKIKPGVNVTNYQKLHKFNASDFAGMVCDEASAIKSFDGKLRSQVTEFLRVIPYRLMATASAAPNDYTELGTQSEALGVMGAIDMMNRFFRNDNNTVDTRPHMKGFHAPRKMVGQQWRFKGHAEQPFFRWVCSWARAGRKPSDLGDFDDSRFVLQPLITREHVVDTRTLADGCLFPMAATNRQEELEERRRTIQERCEFAASLVANTGKPFIVWCQLNPEGDLLEKLLPDAVQIKGADTDEEKEEKWAEFLSGRSRGLVSKHKIGGWGINAQHCSHVVEFADHSYEAHYQGVRRCYRYGQKSPVINDIITTEGGRGAKENMIRKAHAADHMFEQLVTHMHQAMQIDSGYKFDKELVLPQWL